MRRSGKKLKALHILKFIVLGVLFITVLGFGIRELWNCLIPDLFHGPVITFWQGLGLCLLGKMLFGWHGGPGQGFKKRAWDQKLKERYANMSPEEREKMRAGLRDWCRPNNRFSRWYEDPEEDLPKQNEEPNASNQ